MIERLLGWLRRAVGYWAPPVEQPPAEPASTPKEPRRVQVGLLDLPDNPQIVLAPCHERRSTIAFGHLREEP